MSARTAILDPARELEALAALKASIADAIADDPDLLLDMAEGETGIMDLIDMLLASDLMDEALLEGLAKAAQIFALRKERFETRAKTRRAILEQALLLLEVKKLERPVATISLTERKPKVIVTDESQIPSIYFKTSPSLDKKALNEAMAANSAIRAAELAQAKAEGREPALPADIPGVEWDNGSQSLTIRRR